MPPSILVLPGVGNSGPTHWQTLWEQRLPNAHRVPARDWDRPERTGWVAALDHAVTATGGDIVLVAHSLGCLQVAHWVEGGAPSSRLSVRAALLVAPPDPSAPGFPDAITGFAPRPSARLPFPSILVASTNDPYGTFAFATGCAQAWGSRLVNAGALGHINAESGLGEWEAGLRLLDQLVPRG